MRKVLIVIFVVSCCNLIMCSGENKISNFNKMFVFGSFFASSSVVVTPETGAVIQAPTMSLTIPLGALDEETVITYSETDLPPATDSIVPLQVAYKFGPENLQFNKPAQMKICYDGRPEFLQGKSEKTLQIQHYDPATKRYISYGGDVDLVNHCVTTSIYHFSNYILTAQNLVLTNNPPTIGGATFFPGRLIEGLPAVVRTSILDWDASAIVTARFYYRTQGSGSIFKSIVMLPDENDGTGQFYQAKIPASDIFAAGLEYYIEVYDSLNARVTRPTTAPTSFDTINGDIRDSVTPIRFQNTITRMTAGFSRDLTVQVKGNSSATYYPVPAETMTFAGGKGVTSRPNWLSARYTAQVIGGSYIQASFGNLNLSMPINVYPGVMVRMIVLYNSAELPNPFQVNAGTTTALDAAGYDAFNNFIFVHPTFSSEPIIGGFGDPFSEFGKFNASYHPTDKTGTISVSLGGFTSTYNILVKGFGILCQYDVGTFDSTCIFN
ncbi:hypothetical protein EHQ42_18860 [Leptospira levettii]|uniref:hypothetical protein n=1 Tax=Leptospira levettii TaxID=2023178 RepID=UPI001082DBB3|nr:hypothetical protein [Leptospira levettii]TGL07712.1 hypothetical protein EHQ42_18860 [Leptospira levettii]